MRFGPNDGLGLVGSATAPLTGFTWKNTFIVGGNGYGIIATDLSSGMLHNYDNIFFVGPEFDYNINGTTYIKDSQIIIEDPRFSGNNIISYEDINETPYTVTLNLANSTRAYSTCYWGSVAEIKNVVLSGHTQLYKANGRSGSSGIGVFQASNTGTIMIDDGAVVEARHKRATFNNGTFYESGYETAFVQGVSAYNLTVGERANFTFVNDNRFSSGTVDNAYQFNIGNYSKVNLTSNYSSSANRAYLRFSKGLTIGSNSDLDITMKNTAAS